MVIFVLSPSVYITEYMEDPLLTEELCLGLDISLTTCLTKFVLGNIVPGALGNIVPGAKSIPDTPLLVVVMVVVVAATVCSGK